MSSIGDMISELAEIRNALGHEGREPWQRPRRLSPTGAPTLERVSADPIFEADSWKITDPVAWEEEKENTRRAVEGNNTSSPGIEALAWYSSFHDNQQHWGIYIPLSSLALMDELYLGGLPMERDRRLHLAWSALLLHEQMHFAVDYACASLELILRAPIRREFRARFNSKPVLAALTANDAYLEIEETAANARMLRQLARIESRQVLRTVEEFVEKQPSGYRDGLKSTDDAAYAEAIANTLRSYFSLWAIEHRLDLGNRASNLSRLLPLEDDKVLFECPVYAIDDLDDVGVASGSLRLVQCISEIVEEQSFERQLQRQEPAIRRDWSRRREQIKIGLPSPPRFEKLKGWEPPTWSLRLRDGHRVHLESPRPGTNAWRAVAIGNHKEIGHG